jgi:hypothetical protein
LRRFCIARAAHIQATFLISTGSAPAAFAFFKRRFLAASVFRLLAGHNASKFREFTMMLS